MRCSMQGQVLQGTQHSLNCCTHVSAAEREEIELAARDQVCLAVPIAQAHAPLVADSVQVENYAKNNDCPRSGEKSSEGELHVGS